MQPPSLCSSIEHAKQGGLAVNLSSRVAKRREQDRGEGSCLLCRLTDVDVVNHLMKVLLILGIVTPGTWPPSARCQYK